ncbi:NmrA family NAD(P)-binding protein [Psychrobacter sp. AOP22-C1-C5]|uniref:NmrA family NAD(P)-binding protein n=1 Tax=Psychrobacter sp. AOP22-C1-C5 TaxID=3457716 RepID=UPI0040357F5B
MAKQTALSTNNDHRIFAIAGGSGDLGLRVIEALCQQGVSVRALIRKETSFDVCQIIKQKGADINLVDFNDPSALTAALENVHCVISTLNGLEPVLINVQGDLLNAAIKAGVPRFIPSDFSLDFTKTIAGENRNMDIRRDFKKRLDAAPIQATSILCGAFTDLLTGEAPIILKKFNRILYWGNPNQDLNFTTKDDAAHFTALAAMDADAPRILRISGDIVSANELAKIMSNLTDSRYKTLRAGGMKRLGLLIALAHKLDTQKKDVFPAWQGMQYLRDMFSGRGQLERLDNKRYGKYTWTSTQTVLASDENNER